MSNGEKLLIMRNVRRMIEGRIEQPDNWFLYQNLFSAGEIASRSKCRQMNLDPDSIKTGRENA